MLFHFDERYFLVKITIICGRIAKIQFFSIFFRLWPQRAHQGMGFLVCLLESSPQQSCQVSTLQKFFHLYAVFMSNFSRLLFILGKKISPGRCPNDTRSDSPKVSPLHSFVKGGRAVEKCQKSAFCTYFRDFSFMLGIKFLTTKFPYFFWYEVQFVCYRTLKITI